MHSVHRRLSTDHLHHLRQASQSQAVSIVPLPFQSSGKGQTYLLGLPPVDAIARDLTEVLHLQLHAPDLAQADRPTVVRVRDAQALAQVDLGERETRRCVVRRQEPVSEIGGEREVHRLVGDWAEIVSGEQTAEQTDGDLSGKVQGGRSDDVSEVEQDRHELTSKALNSTSTSNERDEATQSRARSYSSVRSITSRESSASTIVYCVDKPTSARD